MGATDTLAMLLAIAFLVLILMPFLPGIELSGGTVLSLLTLALLVYTLAQVSEVSDEVKAIRKEFERLSEGFDAQRDIKEE